MQWPATCFLVVMMVYGGGGVTKLADVKKFWTDDFKIFEQIYGKTSDKEIYGETLPATVTFNNDKLKEASEKHERYVLNFNDPDSVQFDADDNYKILSSIKGSKYVTKKKPALSTINFVSYGNTYKPISLTSEPEMYNYLKHLEEMELDEKEPVKVVKGYKPYIQYVDPGKTETYKSIQEILDAHEANKGGSYKHEDDMKFFSYPKTKKKKPLRMLTDVGHKRCTTRCRVRGTTYRPRSNYKRSPIKTVLVV